jgi:hypothetical protein
LEEIAAAVSQSLTAQSVFGVAAMVGRTVSWIGTDGTTERSGVVTAASFSAAGPMLTVTDGTQVAMGDITSVRATPANPQS